MSFVLHTASQCMRIYRCAVSLLLFFFLLRRLHDRGFRVEQLPLGETKSPPPIALPQWVQSGVGCGSGIDRPRVERRGFST